MTLLKRIFDDQGGLTLEGRVLYAHAMHLSRVDDLPEELVDYVWENDESRNAIAELYELLETSMVKNNPHSFFANTPMPSTFVAIDWNNLDTAMEDILRQALSEQTTPNRKLERKMAISFKASAAAIQVFHPKKDAICIHTITFIFSHKTSEPHWVHFKNAKGESKGEFEIPKEKKEFQISIEDEKQFPMGLYYWTLLVDGTPMTNRLYICTEEDAQKILNS